MRTTPEIEALINYCLDRTCEAIVALPEEVRGDIYAFSLYPYIFEPMEEATIEVSFNTETHAAEATSSASSAKEARWNYAFWLQEPVFDLAFSPDGESLRKAWLRAEDLIFDPEDEEEDASEVEDKIDRIYARWDRIAIEFGRRLSASETFKRSVQSCTPIILHDLEYYEHWKKATLAVNDPKCIEPIIDEIFGWWE